VFLAKNKLKELHSVALMLLALQTSNVREVVVLLLSSQHDWCIVEMSFHDLHVDERKQGPELTVLRKERR